MLRVRGPESPSVCQYDHICAWIKAGIDGAVHEVQDIWDTKLSTKDWGFLLVGVKMHSTIAIKQE